MDDADEHHGPRVAVAREAPHALRREPGSASAAASSVASASQSIIGVPPREWEPDLQQLRRRAPGAANAR
ncbi:hypothetical protein ACFQRB_20530 [Halobaculum litoreum]|uniref:Uncharacterized protein n=1 Tax=Halobaculum litoreum TaxID=3031998 RepID=A0ABD5XSR4_9EURY